MISGQLLFWPLSSTLFGQPVSMSCELQVASAILQGSKRSRGQPIKYSASQFLDLKIPWDFPILQGKISWPANYFSSMPHPAKISTYSYVSILRPASFHMIWKFHGTYLSYLHTSERSLARPANYFNLCLPVAWNNKSSFVCILYPVLGAVEYQRLAAHLPPKWDEMYSSKVLASVFLVQSSISPRVLLPLILNRSILMLYLQRKGFNYSLSVCTYLLIVNID